MRRATVLLTVALCVATFATQSSAQDFNRTSDLPTPTTANAPDKKADAASTPKTSEVTEVEKLRQRVEELEEQQRALVRVLQELKDKLEPAAAPAANTALRSAPESKVESQPVATNSPQNDSVNVRWPELISEGNKLKFYGFMRLDLIFDSQQPNNAQSILFIKSPDPRTGTDNGDFAMHPRLTRFGIDYSGPRIAKLGDAKLTGKLETDFQNGGGSESRQAIRIRHAYLRLDWKEFNVLAGQTWDIVSPLFPTVNSDTLQWNAGNIGDRRPQFRATYEPKAGKGKFSFAGGIGLTGAIDSIDLDGNGVRDGEESARPNIQGRAGFSHPLGGKDRVASFGVSGFYGFLKTSRLVAGRTQFRSQAVNIDFTLPLASWLAFKGEGWWGRNMSDFRGGIGQGFNVALGRAIRGRGGWTEANVRISRYLSLNPGFSVDDPLDADISVGGRTRNRAFFIANRITPGNNFLIGADYLHWKTDFNGFQRGIDNRVNIFLQYNF